MGLGLSTTKPLRFDMQDFKHTNAPPHWCQAQGDGQNNGYAIIDLKRCAHFIGDIFISAAVWLLITTNYIFRDSEAH